MRPLTAGGFDHHDPALDATTIWQVYRELRRQGPVSWSDQHGGFWVVAGYDEAVAAARDHQTFSSADGTRIPQVGAEKSIPLDDDPPLHTEYRALFTRALNPQRVKALMPFVDGLVGSLLDQATAGGEADLVATVALPLPLQVLTEVVGFSQSTVSQLRSLTRDMWRRITDVPLPVARAEMIELLQAEVRRRIDAPTDDYLTWLTTATVAGRPITPVEVTRVLLAFAIAGHETTLNAVGLLLLQLASDAGLQRRLREDASIIPGLIEESLRYRAPAHTMARTATRDCLLGGQRIRKGERLLLLFAAANRDDRRYPDGDSFDPSRDARRHLAFGMGIHQCVGAPLVRVELRSLLRQLRERSPFELTGPPVFSELEGGIHMGLRELKVRFESAAG